MMSMTTTPEPEIAAVEQRELGRRKRDVLPEVKKKLDVEEVENSGMNGGDVNDQYRSYYPPGTTLRKWWKYFLWCFVNLSMVNAYILEKITGKKK